jgi:hypothetical protein
MPLIPSQSPLMKALYASDKGLKWWSDAIGVKHLSDFTRWQKCERQMPEDKREEAFAVLCRERPDLAAMVVQDDLLEYGIVASYMRVEPEGGSDRTHAQAAKEDAEANLTRAIGLADGHRSTSDIDDEARELDEAIAAKQRHRINLARERVVAAAREATAPRRRKTNDPGVYVVPEMGRRAVR